MSGCGYSFTVAIYEVEGVAGMTRVSKSARDAPNPAASSSIHGMWRRIQTGCL